MLVYPVGIPLMYGVLVFRHRTEIDPELPLKRSKKHRTEMAAECKLVQEATALLRSEKEELEGLVAKYEKKGNEDMDASGDKNTSSAAAATTASKGARESREAKKLKEVEKELAARGKGDRPKDVYWEGARARASEAATGHEAVEEARLIRQDNPRLKYIEFLFDSCAFID